MSSNQDIPLLERNAQSVNHRTTKRPEARSRIQRLCRAFGIGFVYSAFFKIPEEKKIAIRKERTAAALAGLIHVIPIFATIVLVFLNLHGYYIGSELAGKSGQDDAKFLALQFAAKLHELCINASLAAVLFSYIRHQLIKPSGLPFGALAAGIQFKDVSYLWSMEFWGIIKARFGRWHEQWALIVLIGTCVFLSISATASSATLMKPRLDWWPAGGTDFWIAIHPDILWSTNITSSSVPASCMSDTGDLACPSAGWQTIAQDWMAYWRPMRASGYIADGFQIPSQRSIRYLYTRHRSDTDQFAKNWTTATVQMSSIADALVETGRFWAWAAFWWRANNQRFWSRKDVSYSVSTRQPKVFTRCLYFDVANFNNEVVTENNGSRGILPFYDLLQLEHFNKTGDFPIRHHNYTANDQVRYLIDNANNTKVPQFAWISLLDEDSASSSLGAAVTLPLQQNESMLFSCTIEARLVPVTMRSTRDKVMLVNSVPNDGFHYGPGDSDPNDHDPSEGFNYGPDGNWSRFSLQPEWATYLNPLIDSDNTTAFQNMTMAAGLYESGLSTYSDPNQTRHIFESLLATTIVNGIGRRDYGIDLAGTLSGDPDALGNDVNGTEGLNCASWCPALLPSGKFQMGYGRNAFTISAGQKSNSTAFTMEANANGWAYSSQGSAAKFAMLALMSYSLIAACHWTYMVWIKESSSSWDSISELVTLAMASNPSLALRNTGAGIESLSVFKEQTNVVDKDDGLQLTVGHDPQRNKSVEVNMIYG